MYVKIEEVYTSAQTYLSNIYKNSYFTKLNYLYNIYLALYYLKFIKYYINNIQYYENIVILQVEEEHTVSNLKLEVLIYDLLTILTNINFLL